MQQDLQAMLGPRECVQCSQKLVPDAVYCHRCGTKQPPPTLTLTFVGDDAPTAEPIVLEDAGITHVVGRTIEPLDHYVQVDLAPYRGKEQGVSRSHAELWFDTDAQCWKVRDTGSQFGTFLDDEQIEDGNTMRLETGQVLRFGGVELQIETEY